MIRRPGLSARAVKVMNTLAASESTAQIKPRARSIPACLSTLSSAGSPGMYRTPCSASSGSSSGLDSITTSV